MYERSPERVIPPERIQPLTTLCQVVNNPPPNPLTDSGVPMIQAIQKVPRGDQPRVRADVAQPSLQTFARRTAAKQPIAISSRQQEKRQKLETVRQYVEELILLSDRQFCEKLVGGLTPVDKAKYREESQRLITNIRLLVGVERPTIRANDLDAIAVQNPLQQPTGGLVRVRLSPAVVRILQAFASTGKPPGQLIERALWNDPNIQDAALLLRVTPPQKRSAPVRHRPAEVA